MTKIESLIGEEINIVSFVMDYVEIHFNGPLIRALNNPNIETHNGLIQFPENGSRDVLCSFIGRKVKSISVKNKVALSLVFSHDEKIIIPLDDDSFNGPEAMHWCPLDEPMQVWQ